MLYIIEYYLFVSTCFLLLLSTFFSNSSYYSTYKITLPPYYINIKYEDSFLLTNVKIKIHPFIAYLLNYFYNKHYIFKYIIDSFLNLCVYIKSVFIIPQKKKKNINIFNFFTFYKKDYINTNNIVINFIIYVYILLIVFFIMNINLNLVIFDKKLLLDNLIVISKFIILLMSFFYFLFVKAYLRLGNILKQEFLIMLQFAILSFILLLNSEDFFELYMSLEMYGLSIVSVIGLKYYNRTTIEAGFKYFLITAVSSLFFLFSFSLLYISTGIYNFTDLKLLIDGLVFFEHINFYIIFFSFILLTLSFLIKLGSFPFNF